MTVPAPCFGFFHPDVAACKGCTARHRCRALFVSHGNAIMAAVFSELCAQEIKEGEVFLAHDKASELAEQVIYPQRRHKVLSSTDDLVAELFGDKPPSPDTDFERDPAPAPEPQETGDAA
jgi:hypothetical protein